jgi:hypothetical protein
VLSCYRSRTAAASTAGLGDAEPVLHGWGRHERDHRQPVTGAGGLGPGGVRHGAAPPALDTAADAVPPLDTGPDPPAQGSDGERRRDDHAGEPDADASHRAPTAACAHGRWTAPS